MKTRPIKPGTLRYLNSAIEFFKKKHGLKSLSCRIKFARFRDSCVWTKCYENILTLGHYNPIANEIVIEGCDYHSRNQLVRTLFHELTHYWQVKIAKKLTYNVQFKNQQVDPLFSDQSLIKDYYHANVSFRELLYELRPTNWIFYWFKPHEIEARLEANKLFDEWNIPEYKGKV